jgi:hypothetical protein
MWTVFYDSTEGARYKITLYADQYLKYIPGPFYSIWIENWQGQCRIGETGEGYHVHYPSGTWDWDTYFGKIKVLGWGEDVRKGLSDTDPKVKEIINDPAIKSLLTSLLKKYSKAIIQDVFEKFRGSK